MGRGVLEDGDGRLTFWMAIGIDWLGEGGDGE